MTPHRRPQPMRESGGFETCGVSGEPGEFDRHDLNLPSSVKSALYRNACAPRKAGDVKCAGMPWMPMNAAITFAGLLINASYTNPGIRDFGAFLVISGCNERSPTIITFQLNNVRSKSRRIVADGMISKDCAATAHHT